jgi:hypothetical protein
MAPLGRRAAVSLPVLALAERVIPQERAAELRQSLPQLTRRPEASQQGRVESASVRHPDHLAQDAPARRQGAAKARSGRTSGVSKHGRSTRDVYADSDDMTRRGGSVSAARHVDLSLSEDEQLSTLSPTALSPLPSGRPGKQRRLHRSGTSLDAISTDRNGASSTELPPLRSRSTNEKREGRRRREPKPGGRRAGGMRLRMLETRAPTSIVLKQRAREVRRPLAEGEIPPLSAWYPGCVPDNCDGHGKARVRTVHRSRSREDAVAHSD